MRRLSVFVIPLILCLLCVGCATDAQKSQWQEAWKDLRGDNMQMRGFGKSE